MGFVHNVISPHVSAMAIKRDEAEVFHINLSTNRIKQLKELSKNETCACNSNPWSTLLSGILW